MIEEAKDMSSIKQAEFTRLNEALERALQSIEELKQKQQDREKEIEVQLQQAEVIRRRNEVQSYRAELQLAEQLAIMRHHDAEKKRLIERLQNDLVASKSALKASEASRVKRHISIGELRLRWTGINKLKRNIGALFRRLKG